MPDNETVSHSQSIFDLNLSLMKISKMANIVYRQMSAPRELPQQIPPGQKLGCKSPRVGQIFGANFRGCAGGMVMDEIDTCIT